MRKLSALVALALAGCGTVTKDRSQVVDTTLPKGVQPITADLTATDPMTDNMTAVDDMGVAALEAAADNLEAAAEAMPAYTPPTAYSDPMTDMNEQPESEADESMDTMAANMDVVD